MNSYLNLGARILIRISAFLRKEIVEIMRQPMLVLTLVLGPFLILLFFGIGYRNEPRSLRTLFVVEDDSRLAERIEQNASTLGKQLIFAGVTDNLEDAQERLRRREVDLVAVVPADAYNTIRHNEQAAFQLYHHEIDPFQIDYINVFARVYVDEANRRLLRYITAEGQSQISNARAKLDSARSSAMALRELLQQCAETLSQSNQPKNCDTTLARSHLQNLDQNIDELELSASDSAQIADAFEQELSPENKEMETLDTSATLADIVRDTNELWELEFDGLSLEEIEERTNNYITQIQTLTRIEQDLELLDDRLGDFLNIDSRVLITPFRSEAKSVATIQTNITDFFAPSVIVLLLQHLTVTFAALSIVRERHLGSMELFNVSPISAIETLTGKYISYLFFGAALSLILFALVVLGMGVPILGSIFSVAAVVVGLLFTSMGIGFIISLVSKTDIQAVQYSMIVLLTSVFFSGFILGLETLWEPVRLISWAIPATYGILLLRDIMLRGDPLQMSVMLQLVAIGIGLFVVAWLLLRRSMSNI